MNRLPCTVLLAIFAVAAAACKPNPVPGEPAAAPSSARADSGSPNVPAPAPVPAPVISKITIPSGTRLHVALIDAVGSAKSSPGDVFTASLVEPIVLDGKTAVFKGTKVRGRVMDANESGRVKGRADLKLTL